MCLAIPGRVASTFEREGLRMARVEFGGIAREVCIECVPEAGEGDYVLVHVGFALSVMDEEEARRTFSLLEELGELAELDTPPPPEG